GELRSAGDSLIAKRQDLWWAYQFRGIAKARGAQPDKAGALDDFDAGLIVAAGQNDANGVETMVRTVVGEIGAAQARVLVAPVAAKESRWGLLLAVLARADGDGPGAFKLVDKMLMDRQLPAERRAAALKMVAIWYVIAKPPDIAKTIAAYRSVLELAPDDSTVLNNLACLLIEPGPTCKPKEALGYSQRAYGLMKQANVEDPNVLDTHGWILVCNNRVEDGINLLRRSVQKKPLPEGFYHLGEAYLKLNPSSPADAEHELALGLQMIRDAEKAGKPVDPTLTGRIEDSLKRARAAKN
ncbi:MAG: hypothetical protein ACREJC_02670, partial [Tepidisphaeraceae bacterium]